MKPGEDLIEQGLKDLAEGNESIAALLVCIGEPRLRSSGVDIPKHSVSSPEIRLYEMLSVLHADRAHSKYNALIRRLVDRRRTILDCILHPQKRSRCVADFSARYDRLRRKILCQPSRK